jgi:hypothetical protein
MADSPNKKAVRDRVWADYIVSLAGQKYTPTPNEILDARITDTRLRFEERADALLERKSAGHWSTFACERDWDTGIATPLGQSDFARILVPQEDGKPLAGKQRVSAWAKLRDEQGYLRLGDGQNPRLLVLVVRPRPLRKDDEAMQKSQRENLGGPLLGRALVGPGTFQALELRLFANQSDRSGWRRRCLPRTLPVPGRIVGRAGRYRHHRAEAVADIVPTSSHGVSNQDAEVLNNTQISMGRLPLESTMSGGGVRGVFYFASPSLLPLLYSSSPLFRLSGGSLHG